MVVYSDSFDFAAEVLPQEAARRLSSDCVPEPAVEPLIRAFLGADRPLFTGDAAPSPWAHLFLTESSAHSNYDQLIELARGSDALPDRIACVAGRGEGFHGFKGRPWSAEAGNIHLAVHFAPDRPVVRFEIAFTVLAALSVVDAIDGIPGLEGRAGIKWVNDVTIDEAKVAGVLAYTQTRDTTVSSAVVGIGLNVETIPKVDPTPFVPQVSSLRVYAPDAMAASQRAVLFNLMNALDRNYRLLSEEGSTPLLERYRQRSTITDRMVTVCSEDSDADPRVIAEGRVVALGDGLELHLEDRDEPVTRGRLIVGDSSALESVGAVDRPHDAVAPADSEM